MAQEKLNELFEKWMALQPLPDIQQHALSRRFTVEYNYGMTQGQVSDI